MDILILHMGITRCYIVQDKGTIMIDSGPPDQSGKFKKNMQKAKIDPKHIKLIVNTHGHYDHTGSTKLIKDITGAQIAMHEPDKEWLEKSINPPIPGVTMWGKILSKISTKPRVSITPVDIRLGDDDFSLAPFGVPGRVIFTPGHTMGSVSVLLETGEAFVGDLVMSGPPLRFNPGLPIFAEDIKEVNKSIKLLVQHGAKIFYPGHGKPFPAEIVRRFVS